jgi:hypothetical protein
MRLLGTRRAALLAGAAAVAAVALTGCSAGQVAETAIKKPSNSGVNADTNDRSVAIRNLAVAYNGPEGYPAGGSAPLEVALANQTTSPITVNVSSRPATGGAPEQGVVSGTMVGLTGGASASAPATPSAAPEPSGSRPPATPDTDTPDNVEPSSGAPSVPVQPSVSAPPEASAQPARLTLPAHGTVSFLAGDQQQLVVFGLTDRLLPGMSVNLVFEFSNGAAPLVIPAPVTVPLSPAPRESGVDAGLHESDQGTAENEEVSENNTGD